MSDHDRAPRKRGGVAAALARGSLGKIEPVSPNGKPLEGDVPENRNTVIPENLETLAEPTPDAVAGEKPKRQRKKNADAPPPKPPAPRVQAAVPDAEAKRDKPVPITVSVPKDDKKRSRRLENTLTEIRDDRDDDQLKGKIGPSLIFRMGLDLLEELEEDELFSLALKNATYQP